MAGSVEPFEPYGSRPNKSAPKSLNSKEAPALQDPVASSGAAARGLNPIPESSTAPVHSLGADPHVIHLHAPKVCATIVQTLQANEAPLQLGLILSKGKRALRTGGESFLQVFECRGKSAVGDILDCVIELLNNITVAAPSWDLSASVRSALTWPNCTEQMEVDDKALPSYAHPTKASAASGSGPKAKKMLNLICIAPGHVSCRESGSAVSNAMTSADEGGAASEAREIMTPEARKSYTDATKAKGKDKAPAKFLLKGIHPSVALSYCQRQAAAAKKAAASASTSMTAPPALIGETNLGKCLHADSTHNMERPDTPSTAVLPTKKLWTADNWFQSLSVEMVNNFALGLRVLGPTAVDFSIDQILATGQKMGSFGFPIKVSSQAVPPPPAPANPPANALAGQGASAPAVRDKGKGKIVIPGTHPTSNTKQIQEQILYMSLSLRPPLFTLLGLQS
ncbi:hypothetical protein BC835DRAFT_1470815 [Cytidiella melzeri]|nr:hypothetical protein BC835DRAFT_1470815 [Cytidiella melzeri]